MARATSRENRFEISSRLAADADVVWRHATNMDRVNDELAPWLSMTVPERVLSIDDPRLLHGERLFRSWIRLFGIIPVDFDDVVIASIDPGRRFEERSSMMTQRRWNHDRCIQPCEGGCVLTDTVSWVPRFAGAGALMRAVVPRLFRWRHQRLRQRFGWLPL